MSTFDMKLLTEAEFLVTCPNRMIQAQPDTEPPFEFWDYFNAIPTADFEGHDCSAHAVSYVWTGSGGHFQHVLVNSEDKNTFMVLILELQSRTVYGHRLLNLNREYGLKWA